MRAVRARHNSLHTSSRPPSRDPYAVPSRYGAVVVAFADNLLRWPWVPARGAGRRLWPVPSALSPALRFVDEHHGCSLFGIAAQQHDIPVRQPNATVGFGF